MPPQVADVLLAAGLGAIDVATVLSYRSQIHPIWLALALVLLQTIPLAWRRAWPVSVLLIVGAARVGYDVAGLTLAPLPLGPAIAFYTVIERCDRRARAVVGALLVLALFVSQVQPGHNQPYDAIAACLMFATAWGLGAVARLRRVYLTEARAQAAAAEAAAAAERTQIARELHDVVAHHVSIVAVQAEAALVLLPDRPERAAASLELIGTTAREALTELRHLLGVLRAPDESPPTSPGSSLADLDAMLERIRESGLEVDLSVRGTPVPLGPVIGLTAYRVVQEALTNALRHAPSRHAAVVLEYEPESICVSVGNLNDGAASSPVGDRRGAPGFGLAGLTERVTSCGGTLTVGPTARGGFAVSARLPTR